MFENDFICLTGLIELTSSVLGEETVDGSKALLNEKQFQGKVKGCQPQVWVTRISCLFLVTSCDFKAWFNYTSRNVTYYRRWTI